MRLGAWVTNLIITKEEKGGEGAEVGTQHVNNQQKNPVLGLARSKKFNSCVYVNRMHVTA